MFRKLFALTLIVGTLLAMTSEAEAGWLLGRRTNCGKGITRVRLLQGFVVRNKVCSSASVCEVVSGSAPSSTQAVINSQNESVQSSTQSEINSQAVENPAPKTEAEAKPLAPKLPSDVPSVR